MGGNGGLAMGLTDKGVDLRPLCVGMTGRRPMHRQQHRFPTRGAKNAVRCAVRLYSSSTMITISPEGCSRTSSIHRRQGARDDRLHERLAARLRSSKTPCTGELPVPCKATGKTSAKRQCLFSRLISYVRLFRRQE